MIIKTVQTLVFEYPEDYQAEIEWNKKRDGDWVHQSRDTMCSVYTLTNNYLIPTKAKHSFLDNPYFEAEPRTEEPSFTATDFGKGTITRYTDEPQTDCPQSAICCKPCKECGACEKECGMWEILKNATQTENE